MKKKVCKKCGSQMAGKFCENCGGKAKGNTGLIVGLIILAFIIIGVLNPKDEETITANGNNDNEGEAADLSNIDKVYELTSGYYTAKIDLPEGKCNITVISGKGNVSSSNMYSGGLNEMMGVGDPELYATEFNGLKMDDEVTLSVSNGVKIRLEYTSITNGYIGRQYDDSKAIELSNGNYVAGTDFPAGIYNIIAVLGNGNVSTSNLFSGGINAMMGVSGGEFYETEYKNVNLAKTVELTISNGVTVRLVPEK